MNASPRNASSFAFQAECQGGANLSTHDQPILVLVEGPCCLSIMDWINLSNISLPAILQTSSRKLCRCLPVGHQRMKNEVREFCLSGQLPRPRCCVQAIFHLSSTGLPGSCDPVAEADEISQLAQPLRESQQPGKPERDKVIADLLKRLEDLTVALDDWQLVEQVGSLVARMFLSLGC